MVRALTAGKWRGGGDPEAPLRARDGAKLPEEDESLLGQIAGRGARGGPLPPDLRQELTQTLTAIAVLEQRTCAPVGAALQTPWIGEVRLFSPRTSDTSSATSRRYSPTWRDSQHSSCNT